MLYRDAHTHEYIHTCLCNLLIHTQIHIHIIHTCVHIHIAYICTNRLYMYTHTRGVLTCNSDIVEQPRNLDDGHLGVLFI